MTMLTVAANSLLQLTLVALPVLVGYLAGRHIRRRHLDQIEHDAWNDGFQACSDAFLAEVPERFADEFVDQLDAAVEQAHPSDQPWLN